MFFLYNNKKWIIVSAILLVLAIGTFMFIKFKYKATDIKDSKVSASSAVTSLKDEYLSLANKAEREYVEAIKDREVSTREREQVRFETVYNKLYDEKIKSLLNTIKAEDKEVDKVIKEKRYPQPIKVVTIELEDKSKKDIIIHKDEKDDVKVGGNYLSNKVLAIRKPTSEDIKSDSRAYLISEKAVNQITKEAEDILGVHKS